VAGLRAEGPATGRGSSRSACRFSPAAEGSGVAASRSGGRPCLALGRVAGQDLVAELVGQPGGGHPPGPEPPAGEPHHPARGPQPVNDTPPKRRPVPVAEPLTEGPADGDQRLVGREWDAHRVLRIKSTDIYLTIYRPFAATGNPSATSAPIRHLSPKHSREPSLAPAPCRSAPPVTRTAACPRLTSRR